MPPKRKIKGTAHASPEQRKKDLLAASRACFSKEGYSGATIEKIAAQAGLSKGSVYRFFKSKDDILIALLSAYEVEFETRWEEVRTEATSILDMIRLNLRLLFMMSVERGDMERVWIEFAHQDVSKEKFAELFGYARADLSQLIRQGIEDGEIKDAPVEVLTDLLLATHEGLNILAHVDHELDPLKRFDEVWPLLEAGVGKPKTE